MRRKRTRNGTRKKKMRKILKMTKKKVTLLRKMVVG